MTLGPSETVQAAETAILGSVLIDPMKLSEVDLEPGDFAKTAHQHVWAAMGAVWKSSGDLDAMLVWRELDRLGLSEAAGGPEWLADLAQTVPSSRHAAHYARIVRDAARLRRIADAGEDIAAAARKPDAVADEVADSAESAVYAAGRDRNEAGGSVELGDLIRKRVQEHAHNVEFGKTPGLRTHFADLDGLVGGLQPGEMTVLAARPSMGKTALAMNIAENVARGGMITGNPDASRAVLFVSLEMTRDAVADRLLSSSASIDMASVRSSNLSPKQVSDLERSADVLNLPLIVDDSGRRTVPQMRARLRREIKRRGGVDQPGGVGLMVVDYLQLVNASGKKENRQVEVSSISSDIKDTAKELGVPVLILAQLNRSADSREDKRPMLSDLRESGAVEQDADMVWLLFREEYYYRSGSDRDKAWKNEHPDEVSKAEVVVAKNRNGPTGFANLHWESSCVRFRDWGKRYSYAK
jgi:replicative DNA helicase